MRASKEDHWKALKLGTFRLIDACGDGEAVPMTRVKAAALSKYKAMHDLDSFIPVDVAFDLELLFGVPVLTETLARLHGRKLVAIEKSDGTGDAVDLRGQFETIEDDVARLRLKLRDVLADGHIDAGERVEVRRKLDLLRRAIDDMEGLL